ncbi:MAG: hypothetical protein ACRDD1_02200 [Planctomycetia bacterium]
MTAADLDAELRRNDAHPLDDAALDAPNEIALVGYLEEALPDALMVRIEDRLRASAEWRAALDRVRDAVDLGEHSVATIWRRHRLTCATREQLGAYLMQASTPAEEDYLRFHLEVVACRWCQANLADLRAGRPPADHDPTRPLSEESADKERRRRLFQSSVGYLPPGKKR